MFESESEFKVLVELGLTLLEARVYNVLAINGAMKAKEIAQKSGVSRPDVYRTLLKLSELSLVEKVICNPCRFKAIPPENAIKILFNRKKNSLEDIKIKSEILIQKIRNYSVQTNPIVEQKFVLIPPKETIVNKIKKSIRNSKKSIDVITSNNRFQHACLFLADDLTDAWSRNVNGRAIFEKSNSRQKMAFLEVWKKPLADYRQIQQRSSKIIAIFDEKEVFVFTKPYANFKESPALWSNDPVLISLSKYYFESIWNQPQDWFIETEKTFKIVQ